MLTVVLMLYFRKFGQRMKNWIIILSFVAVAVTLFNIFTYHDVYIKLLENDVQSNDFRSHSPIAPTLSSSPASASPLPSSSLLNSLLPFTTLSIVILTYNNSQTLHDILISFQQMSSPFPTAIVIIDNGCFHSNLRVINNFQSIYPLTHLKFCNNTQYSLAYNLAARTLQSEWLLLLNDDVVPRQHFLHNFFHQISIFLSLQNEIGAVGCKLLFPNQRIIEAGSVIRSDGGTDNFLRDGDPCNIQSRHVRSIHYGSAACLFVKHKAFMEAGGFDGERYKAYFEDTHLQMNIRHTQHQLILYSPFIQAVHKEHGTFGSSQSQQLMLESRSKFQSYWSSALQLFHPHLDTPSQSHGALSALLISRDTRSCTTDRALIVACSVTDLLLIVAQLLNLQKNNHYLLTILIDQKICSLTPSSFCFNSCNENNSEICDHFIQALLKLYSLKFLQTLLQNITERNLLPVSFLNIIVRMFRALGIEVLWTSQEFYQSSLCLGELYLWTKLTTLIVSQNPKQSSPFNFSSSPQLEIKPSGATCVTDIDDCDCDTFSTRSSPITLSQLLDERRGFYHLAVFIVSPSPSSLSSSIFPSRASLSLKNLLPDLIHDLQQNLTINEPCVAPQHFPIFLDLRFKLESSRNLSITPIPLTLNSNHQLHSPSGSGGHLRGNKFQSPQSEPLVSVSISSKEAANQLFKILNSFPNKRQQANKLNHKDILDILILTNELKPSTG